MPALTDFDLRFLKKSSYWLTDPEIKALTLTPDFTEKDQLLFYNSLPKRKNYWIMGILENSIPIGAMGLKNIDQEKSNAEYWGYIGEKQYWGKGIGKFMINEAFAKAKQLNLDQLYLKVDSKNMRAKKLYINSGFSLSHFGVIEQYDIKL